MKQLFFIFILFLVALTSCNDDDNTLLMAETGTVLDYAGTGGCGIVIELDNGTVIQPLYYPEGFIFTEGQRVLVEYTKLKKVMNACEEGTPCEISYVEELSCAPYVDLYFENYDSLARDPVHMHEAYLDGDCLYFKLSYGGGCQEHTITLARLHSVNDDDKVPVFEIRHDANDDLCEAWFTREFRFNISGLREEGISKFTLATKLINGEVYNKTFELN
ncbi:NigD-like C-terminal domain-containing protein [Maribellus sp. YY47]|uniref:NigD1/NigD2 family lipoprotein n=1 Tax=Maribellus sp. YY47 TaxID=2929486 RepID=UPI0020019697|nr:NigD-like C-terminal domain-containing protein [Maribellus sp. YY47]MCK3684643.1 NigD-like protein [Maribellus sp. YY47]